MAKAKVFQEIGSSFRVINLTGSKIHTSIIASRLLRTAAIGAVK